MTLDDGDVVYRFGALSMPDGYAVVWHDCVEHYIAHGPHEWESVVTCNPHQARRWCLRHAQQQGKKA
jgi:hypothetical protein